MRFPGGKEKALTLSYDDGNQNDIKLVEILNRYGIKATLNVNSGMFGNTNEDWRLPAQTVKELALSGGHEIAVHGVNHIALGKATITDGIREVLYCRDALEKEFGGIIRGMAYADTGVRAFTAGVTLSEIEHYLKELGIAYARTLGKDNCDFAIPEDFYEWMPTVHSKNPELMNYLKLFLDAEMPSWCAKRSPLLFYMWGHSYEFEQDNNWDLLEQFCQTAGGHDEVWYATNIEIYDYVMAYRALQFSVDNTTVFNPTCQTVWFEADGEVFSVEPGQYVNLGK